MWTRRFELARRECCLPARRCNERSTRSVTGRTNPSGSFARSISGFDSVEAKTRSSTQRIDASSVLFLAILV